MPLYSAALALALFFAAPWWLFRMLTTERYREGLRERLGRVPAAFRAVTAGQRIVWLHAVSVGEVLAASSLVAALERELGPGVQVVISTTTRTGQHLARKRFGPQSNSDGNPNRLPVRVFYFPLDFRFAVRAWLRALRPELVTLTESELWPRLLHECAARSIPVAVVNARVSDRSFRRSSRIRPVWRWMARYVTLWLAQTEADADRLLQLGASPSSVRIAGNLKYDTDTPRETLLARAIRSGAQNRAVILAGSTVAYGTTPEEGIVLDAMQSHVWPDRPGVLLVLAPRHPERFAEAVTLAAQFGTTIRSTELLDSVPGYRIAERILVLDTIGDLAALYRIASVAFVGGSLLPHGGHNPLEPAQFGVPVVMGPHVDNFRDITDRLRAADGVVLLQGTEPRELGEALAGLLADSELATAIGEHGRAVFEQQKGATARTVAALLPLLKNPTAENQQATENLGSESPAASDSQDLPAAPSVTAFSSRVGSAPAYPDSDMQAGGVPGPTDEGVFS